MTPAGDPDVETAPGDAENDPGQPGRFTHLPPPVPLEDTIATHETEPAPDPQAGRDTDREFMLRNAAP